MTCLICAGPAEEVARHDDWEERRCSECGHYRMANSLVHALMDQGQIFDVEKAREWLSMNRKGAQIPHIDSVNGLLRM